MISLTCLSAPVWLDTPEPYSPPPVQDCSAVVDLTGGRRAQIEARFCCSSEGFWFEPVRANEIDQSGELLGPIDLRMTWRWLKSDAERWERTKTALLTSRLKRLES